MVVLALLSTAVLSVRNAVQERRARAEHAFLDARECALACATRPSELRAEERRRCGEAAQRAADLCLELPEHSGQQWELRAALNELVSALESGNQQRLADAIDRSSHASRALGWQAVQTRLR